MHISGGSQEVPAQTSTAARAVLLVDDEVTVNDAHARLLAALLQRAGTTAVRIERLNDPARVEPFLASNPGCAVVVSDLQMPGMTGLELLERVRAAAPDVSRILLTGHADLPVAMEAINRASIFRFLTKPCDGASLCAAVVDALEQHRLRTAERQLLEKTLRGSVLMLVEMLALIDPPGSMRALRIQQYATHVARILSPEYAWAIEIAGMLSHLGSLTLASRERPSGPAAPDHGAEHGEDEARAGAQIGYELLRNIPRLELAAEMIARQHDPAANEDRDLPPHRRDPARLGGSILRTVIAFDAAVREGQTREAAIGRLRHAGSFEPLVLDCLRTVDVPEATYIPITVTVEDLRVGMILDEDLRASSGVLLMAAGHQVTEPQVLKLRALASRDDKRRPIRVLAAA